MLFGSLEARWTFHTGPTGALIATTPLQQRRGVSRKVEDLLLSRVIATYLLFSKPSSMKIVQKPWGFALVAFLITVIFIVVS